MATRMQQRKGTAAQWISTNNGDGPVLNAGEIGYEIDTNKFKIGDGVNHWVDLNYFVDGAELTSIIDGAPAALNTLNEIAAAINDDPAFFTTIATNLSNHQADTTNIHGISNTADLVFTSQLSDAITQHSADTTGVHGIDDTAELATKAFAASLLTGATKTNITISGDKNGLTISAENGVADSDTDDLAEGTTNKYFTAERAQDAVGLNIGSGLAYDTVSNVLDLAVGYATEQYVDNAVQGAEVDQSTLAGSGLTWDANVDQFTVDTTTIQARVADVSDTEIGYLNGVTSAIQTQLDAKAPTADPTFTGTVSGVTKSHVGLGNVDNTSDANKPVSTATQSALDAKAPIESPTFTGTVAGITKSMVGLGNVDNTSDANKPVSSATQTALDAKASLAGATFTGNVEVDGNLVVDGDFTVNGTNFSASATSITIEDNMVQLAHQNAANTVDLGLVVAYNDGTAKHAGIVRDVSANKWKLFEGVTTEPTTTVDFTQGTLDDLQVAGFEATSATIGDVSNTELQYLNGVTSAIQTQIDSKAPTADPTFTGTVSGVTKAHVGLGNVDNTSDANKPVSTATQTALDLKANLVSPTFTGTVTLPSGTVTSAMILDGTIVDGDISASAAIAQSKISGLSASFAAKADLASPTFTGTVTIPTGGVITTPSLTLSTTTSTVNGRIAWDGTNDKIIVGDGTLAIEFAPSTKLTNAQTASYTTVLADKDKIVEMNVGSANNLTVPLNSSVAYPIGSVINIVQTGSGQTTVVATSGVTVNATPGLKLRAQWSSASLIKRGTDTWVLVGDLVA